MKKVPLLIAFSDLHIQKPSKHNEDNKRTLDFFRVLFIIRKICRRLEVPAVFMGDMFHNPEGISNELLQHVMESFSKLDTGPDWALYFISGNHDMCKRNSFKKPSPSIPVSLSNAFTFLKPMDFKGIVMKSKSGLPIAKLFGVPYLDNNVGMQEVLKMFSIADTVPNIVMIHSDFPGAKDTDGREIGTAENLNRNLLDKFDLTLMGHIHKPQRLGKKILMVGATHQQRRTDKHCELGYWVIYTDLSRKFISLNDKFPKFIDVTDEDEIKDDGNYYTLLPKPKKIKQQKVNTVSRTQTKKKIVAEYMKVKGIDDNGKKKRLIKVIKEADDD